MSCFDITFAEAAAMTAFPYADVTWNPDAAQVATVTNVFSAGNDAVTGTDQCAGRSLRAQNCRASQAFAVFNITPC
jgi:hypothetical protein